jgi:dCMP deaminase
MSTTKKKTPPRKTPDRDSRYMGEAWICAGYSKDPNTQVGAKIVTADNEPLGSGYNGPSRNINDNSFDWARPDANTPEDEVTKYDVVVHAEVNAINHSKGDVANATLYVTAMPCKDCMKVIIDKGIKRVVYMDLRYASQNEAQRRKVEKLARMAGVKLEKFEGNINWLPDWIAVLMQKGVFDLK